MLVTAGLLLVSTVGYAIHFDPWKDSVLFQRLLRAAEADPPLPVDLLAGQETILLTADGEADALLKDGFNYQSAGRVSNVLPCGKWTFPADGPARFLRDGSILRGDNHIYVVEIFVDETCAIRKADGRVGPVPFF